MKIMHVSLGLPPLRTGGLTKYSVDLMRTQQQLSHEVSLLYPGHYTMSGNLTIKKNEPYEGVKVYEIVNPLPVSLLGGIKRPKDFIAQSDRRPYELLLQQVKPDVIHMHTLMGIHKQFLEAAKACNINIVYTAHDYFGLCPKVNLLNSEGTVCEDFEAGAACISCNQNGYSSGMIYLMQSRVYRQLKDHSLVKNLRKKLKGRIHSGHNHEVENSAPAKSNLLLASQYVELRDYYMEMFALIDRFHFNSSIAQHVYRKYGLTRGDVLSIRHSDLRDRRTIRPFQEADKPLRFTYLGPVDSYKGFFVLKQSLEQLKAQTSSDWHLHVYGDDGGKVLDNSTNHYTFHGRYQCEDLPQIFDQTDVLIIPSICKETFGFVGMEALAHGVPILVSDRVGFTDMIRDGVTGLIFNPEVPDLTERLNYILENRQILNVINENIYKMEINFSMKDHAEEVISWYPKVEEEVKI